MSLIIIACFEKGGLFKICYPALKKGGLYRIWVVCHSVRSFVCLFVIIFLFSLNIFRTLL